MEITNELIEAFHTVARRLNYARRFDVDELINSAVEKVLAVGKPGWSHQYCVTVGRNAMYVHIGHMLNPVSFPEAKSNTPTKTEYSVPLETMDPQTDNYFEALLVRWVDIQEHLKRMPAQPRLLWSYFMIGWTCQEIAEELNLVTQTVTQTLSRYSIGVEGRRNRDMSLERSMKHRRAAGATMRRYNVRKLKDVT